MVSATSQPAGSKTSWAEFDQGLPLLWELPGSTTSITHRATGDNPGGPDPSDSLQEGFFWL